MRFDRESYRKLYVVESPEHQLLPLLVRGVRDYLLRFASEDGTLLSDTSDPVGDLAVVLRARPKERRHVETVLGELQRVGYLRIDGKRMWLPRFAEAQSARTPGAVRQQRLRDKRNHGDDGGDAIDGVTSNAPATITSNVTSNARGTLPTTDETRRDETTTPKPPVVVACPGDLKLTDGQRGTLETAMIPGWAIDRITSDFIANFQANPEDRRELSVWRKCLSRAISGTWNDASRRPKRADVSNEIVWDLDTGKQVS